MSMTPAITRKLLTQTPLNIVGWDLECTSLSGMIGRILCCSFKPLDQPVYTMRADRRPYRGRDIVDDSRLAAAIRDELERYDLLVSHNGKLFDSKFLAARLFKAGERPRENRLHVDTMWAVRSHLRISSKLANVEQFLELDETKTPISWDNWARAGAFSKAGMDEVVRHCEADVRVLEGVYKRLVPYIGELKAG
jgi:uncharacterized protein YprB with RNaseH-like and TPR domain